MVSDEINQFKRELHSYNRYLCKLQELNDRLEEVNNELIGVSSPGFKEVVIENKSGNNNKLNSLMRKMDLEEKRANIYKRIKDVDAVLQLLDDKDKDIIKDIYLNGVTYENKANEIGYSRKGLQFHVDKVLKKNLKGTIF